MFVRLGLFALALATLLISIIVEAQPLSSLAAPPAEVATHLDMPSLQDVAVIWLHVVKDGQLKKLAFAPEELARTPVISVDGYVNGIVLLSTAPLSASVNRKPMIPIRMNADGYYKLNNYGDISQQEFWTTFLPADLQGARTQQIQGRYSIFPKVPGDALSHAPEFQVALSQKSTTRSLTICQNAGAKIDIGKLMPAGSCPGSMPEVYYLGDNPGQFDAASPAFCKRMRALLTGIQSIEKSTGEKIVDAVHILDYDGTHNAYSCNDENAIWLYSKVFWDEKVPELRVMAEHETMHILSDRLGLSASSRVRELFAELMGFGMLSWERFYVVTGGTAPATRSADPKPIGSSYLFDFINEANFIRGMNGGHSQDNIDEFCASYLHTLMYIDRLAPLLSQPLKTRNGDFITLSLDDRARLLNDYEQVLKTIISETETKRPAALVGFFQTCRKTTGQAQGCVPALPLAGMDDRK